MIPPRLLFLVLTLNLAAACAPNFRAKLESALTEARAENSRITQQRDHYRDAAAKAQAMIEKAYVRGIRDGHSAVKCVPSWPELEVGTDAKGRLFKRETSKGAFCLAGYSPEGKPLTGRCKTAPTKDSRCPCERVEDADTKALDARFK